jgi:uncharacterized Zn-binding protein involved in type VI secretion
MVTGIVPHVGGPILPPGVPTVLIDFLPAATVTDMATCVGPPDVIVMGSAGVFINYLPAARLGDQTAHGGVIVMGSPTCIIGEIGSPSPGAAGAAGVVAGLAVSGAIGSFAANPSVYAPPSAPSVAEDADRDGSEAVVTADGGSSAGPARGETRCRGNSLYRQQEPMSCVLASSRMIIRQMTGTDPGEAALRDEARTAGWFDPLNGSDPWQIPTLLQNHGVAGATARNHLSLGDIQTATAGGKPVMVGLKNPGHRILVDGVRNNADGSRSVLVRVPGYPGAGGCREVPAGEFLERYNNDAPVISFK